MCLLVNQKKGHSFSNEWLKDFFKSNDDGIGVMYAEDNVLYTAKLLPKNEQELIDFYRKHIDGKSCSFHLRMRTHGDTDLDNCHPYQVFSEEEGYPLYLMHNGVLHTGNKADPTKSDTWHYIQDIIRPALAADKTQFMAPWFKTLIEDHIGPSNKFVMMDAYGNVATFNEDSGVDWNGNWMSNTYAWSAGKAGLYKNYYRGGYSRLDDWDADYGYNGYSFGNTAKPLATVTPINGAGTQGKLLVVDDEEETVSQNDNDSPSRDELRMNATNDEIADALDFADMLFSSLEYYGMGNITSQITKALVCNRYLDNPESAWDFFSDLELGLVSTADVYAWLGTEPEVSEDDHLKVGMQ